MIWYPRERNVFADMLANLCLDRRQSFAVRCQTPLHADVNYVTVSDGASRASTQSSSASWGLFAVTADHFHLVAAGAAMCNGFVSSMDAELVALELATGALLKLSRGYRDVVPHATDTTLSESEFLESYHHVWNISKEIGDKPIICFSFFRLAFGACAKP